MSDHQRPRRVSVTVREGPKTESRGEKSFSNNVHEIFNCCDGETTCVHRKSLTAGDLRLSASWTHISDIPDDLMPFVMEHAVSDAEVPKNLPESRVSEDEILDDFKRAVRCLKSDFKTFAANNFDRFIKEDAARAMKEIWPELEDQLIKTASTGIFGDNFHGPASRKFPFAILELYKMENEDGARKMLSAIFDLILTEDEEISRYWVDCLEKLIEACNSAHVQRDIFPNIVGRFVGKGSTVNGKIGACRLFKKLANRFNHEVIQKKLLPLIESLAKDKDPMVRANAAVSLPEMFHRIKKKEQALKLINLISVDLHPAVRSSILYTIVQSVTLMNPKEPKNKPYFESVMQTIKGLVKDAYVRVNMDLLIAYSECMGRVSNAFHIAEVMKPRDVLWYLDAFLQLCRFNAHGNDDSHHEDNPNEEDTTPPGFANFRANMEFNRRQSIVESLISTKAPGQTEKTASQMAFNTAKAIAALRANAEHKRMSIPYGGGLPGTGGCCRRFGPEFERAHECRANAAKEFYDFMLFAKPIVDFRYGLHPLVVDLMHDVRPEVRAEMAHQILPIMEYLGPEASLLHGELVYGLTDDDLDVIQALVPNLSRILKCLVAAKLISPDRVTPKLVEIGGAILYCEERLNQTTFYSVHQTILEQFSALPMCMPGDYIYTNFVPALFHRLRHMRQIPCRMAAAVAIVIFLRHCRRSSQREDIRKKIKEGFAHGRSVHDRMLFIYIAKKIMEKFSRRYFRDHFFEDVLLLAHDPVGNVRRKVMEIIPELKEESDDPNLLRKLEDTFKQARKSEMDRDVKEAIEETLAKIQAKNKSGEHGEYSRNRKVRDPVDEAKEQEEEFIASLESYDGPSAKNATVKEKRKSFYGTGVGIPGISGRRKSLENPSNKASAKPSASVNANAPVKTKK